MKLFRNLKVLAAASVCGIFFGACSGDGGSGSNMALLLAMQAQKTPAGTTEELTVSVTGISLNKSTVEMDADKQEQIDITATIIPLGAKGTVSWQSDDESVATVVSKTERVGTITAKKAGKARIAATVGKFSAYIDVTVKGTEQPAATKYTVTYNLNGGSGTAPASSTVEEGTSITLAATSATKAGYTFAGWAESSTATEGATGSYKVTKNVTLYAVWKAISDVPAATKYTVTYNLNGGSGTAPASSTVEEGTSITLAATTATKAGYTFAGWAESTTATEGATGSYTVTKDVTLYAVWKAVPAGPTDAKVSVTIPAPENVDTPVLKYETIGGKVTVSVEQTYSSYKWILMKGKTGTNQNSTGKSVSVDFDKLEAGIYSIVLQATDSAEKTHSAAVTVTVR